ncbi:hypothetical protein C8P63_101161 [Melghirimyces profundicolus]|uniref:Uncharacterized protein n=1 Tax=Melghirimyces profundicolus TaxID=1242148 RepID=A0A2T6C9F0_9BACL|nr:hypothetical protein [Melghirimyces profundicolus]PTX64940.1 hypothetical protein C8P63_101161 [Melghirimyces profundicolus]
MSKHKNKRRKKRKINRSADEVEFAREPGAADDIEFKGGDVPDFAADEVKFTPEPGAADDVEFTRELENEVEFGRELEALGSFDQVGVTPGPNPTDAVEFQGAMKADDVDRGEEIRQKHRGDRLREEETWKPPPKFLPWPSPSAGNGRKRMPMGKPVTKETAWGPSVSSCRSYLFSSSPFCWAPPELYWE